MALVLRRESACAFFAASLILPLGTAGIPACDSPPTPPVAAFDAIADIRSVAVARLIPATDHAASRPRDLSADTANSRGSFRSAHRHVARSTVLLRKPPTRLLALPAGLPLF